MVTTQRSLGIDNAKTLYDLIRGDQTNWLLFLGGESAADVPLNSIDDDNKVWESSNFFQKIRESDVEIVARRVNWSSGNVYHPYESSGIPTGVSGPERNYYALTEDDEVFVCLGSNAKNRKDLNGQSTSTVKPSRTKDNQTLSDGYRWKFLYKIDVTKIKFKTPNNIPVPDINEYDPISSSATLSEEALRRGCGNNSGLTGSCCFYHKEDEVEPVLDTLFTKGSFDFCLDNVPCAKCFKIARRLNREFTYKRGGLCAATGGATACAASISSNTGYEKALANLKFFSPNSNNKLQTEVYRDAKRDEGQVHNAFIDLSGLTESERTISTSNPEITLSSLSGTDATVILTTYKKDGSHVVDGIRVVNKGSGYRDLTCVSTPGDLQSRVTFSLDYQGGLFADPRRLLGAAKVMIKSIVRVDQIPTNANTNQTIFKRYGIIRDVKVKNDTSSYIAGSKTNTDQAETFSNVHKFKVSPGSSSFSFASGSETFSRSSKFTNVTNESTGKISSIGSIPTQVTRNSCVILSSKDAGGGVAEVEAIAVKDTPFVVGDRLAANSNIGTSFEITEIVSSPDVKPFTGKIVSSNSTDITVTNTPQQVSFTFLYTLGSY